MVVAEDLISTAVQFFEAVAAAKREGAGMFWCCGYFQLSIAKSRYDQLLGRA